VDGIDVHRSRGIGDHDQQQLVDSQADVGDVRNEQTVAAVW
jgi:hypothetical protein